MSEYDAHKQLANTKDGYTSESVKKIKFMTERDKIKIDKDGIPLLELEHKLGDPDDPSTWQLLED
jgi:uncharacterized protein YxjI